MRDAGAGAGHIPIGEESVLFLFVQRIVPAASRLEIARREFGAVLKQYRSRLSSAPLDLRRRVLAHELDRDQQRTTAWPGEPSTLGPAILRLASARSPYTRRVDAEAIVSDSLIVGRGIAAAVRCPFEFRLYSGARYAVRSVRHPGSPAGSGYGVVVREGVALMIGATLASTKRDGTPEVLRGISPSCAASVLQELSEVVATLDQELTRATREYREAIRQMEML
ncbi:hypothetical protein EPN44_12370 [bacterium]|nr:MAG: hypothetical protein EPN44_12370 [bacterium]